MAFSAEGEERSLTVKVTSWRKYHIYINYDKDELIQGRLVI
jgi:hypothetical protein